MHITRLSKYCVHCICDDDYIESINCEASESTKNHDNLECQIRRDKYKAPNVHGIIFVPKEFDRM